VYNVIYLHFGWLSYQRRTCRPIAQTVRRRFPTSVTLVQSQVELRGIFVKQSGTGIAFLLVLRFPLPIPIQPAAPHSFIILSSMQYSPDADSVVKEQTSLIVHSRFTSIEVFAIVRVYTRLHKLSLTPLQQQKERKHLLS
jgi:hypothetical protein